MAKFHGRLAEIYKRVKDNPEYITTEMIIEFIDNLKQRMEEKGISKAELARRLGKSRSYVTKLLLGYYENITIGTLVKIALALGEKPDSLRDLLELFAYPQEEFGLFEADLECEVSYEEQPCAA